ncbi:transmembrane protein 214-A [Leptopilina boulardi]|uniref:transmembrane protein 214-A n=1 Tax=Leptopilina boulardi TaxID=63433 RepID=UPI0021F690FA|nr:transmembrane protein 214-A [Leptopilina boulardi]
MSSGGWEVVGKNKKDKSGVRSTKLTKAEKKKFIENAPKVEDFLPLDQVKTLYDNLEGNKENKKPPKGKDSKTKENEERKKQQKQQQQQQQQTEKKKEIPKEKPPKSIEDALRMINASEVEEILIAGQTRFPGAPLIWLKDLVAFLNMKIPLEVIDPIFSGRPDDYPASVVPKSIRIILEKAIQISGSQNVQLFYEFNLTAMASDLVKNQPVIGYKIFLQLLAKFNPEMTITSIPKLITLRNSYQNRKPIGLSIIWALSQSGKDNLTVGLSVWHHVISPMLEGKNYANYVSQILKDLITRHSNGKNVDVKAELYLNIIDDVISGKLNIAPTYVNEIKPFNDKLREMVFKSPNLKCRSLFETLMTKLTPKSSANYREEIVQALVACLIKDSQCFNVWKNMYNKNLYQSDLLLKNINTHWNTLKVINKNNLFLEMLEALQTTHKKTKKNKDILAGECNKTCEILIKKMTAKTTSGFPWKKGCFILLLLIGSLLAFDCRKNGSFEASRTNKFLKDSGALVYGQKIWTSTKTYSNDGLKYIETRFPDYYKTTVEFTAPYVKLGNDVFIVSKNISIKFYDNAATYVTEKTPIVIATIEQYAPGMLSTIEKQSIKGLEFIKKSSTYVCEQIVDRSVMMVKWLETNVFVGKLSPQNLQKYANQAIDTTQSFASQTYDWVYEKVQTLSKIQ